MQTATSIGSNAPNAPSSRQPYHSSATIPLLPHAPIVISSAAPAPQAPSLTLSSSSTPIAIHDTPDPISSGNRVTNLVKPSFFSPPSSSSTLMMPPISSSVPTAPALNPPLSLQRPYGAPMLQPFPPPTPPPSLTPSSAPPIDRPLITREKVRDALLMLVQVFEFFLFSHLLISYPFFLCVYVCVCVLCLMSNFVGLNSVD